MISYPTRAHGIIVKYLLRLRRIIVNYSQNSATQKTEAGQSLAGRLWFLMMGSSITYGKVQELYEVPENLATRVRLFESRLTLIHN